MKDTLYAAISVFVKTAVFFLCIILPVIFSPLVRTEGSPPSLEYFLYQISRQGAEVFLAALFLALVSVHFRIIRKPGKKPLTFVLVFVAAFSLLYSGLYGLGVFFPEQEEESAPAQMSVPLRADTIERAGGAFVWTGPETPGTAENRRSGPAPSW